MLWSFYPLLFVLIKTHAMDLDTEAIVFCVLDILAKCEFRAPVRLLGRGPAV
jgi:bacteriorhodopsin